MMMLLSFARTGCCLLLGQMVIPISIVGASSSTTKSSTSSSVMMSHGAIEKIADKSIDRPDWLSSIALDRYNSHDAYSCDDNEIVMAWCDYRHNHEVLQCGQNKDYDEYGCNCYDHPSLCPLECIDGTELIQKTHHSIRCSQIPIDQTPNYDILLRYHNSNEKPQQMSEDIDNDVDNDVELTTTTTGCDNNLVISLWCNDQVNPHLTCSMNYQDDTYGCDCSGKISYCPMECIDGTMEPLVRTNHRIQCSRIPLDQPNYILK